ncbi:IS66 family transposase [Megasphaera sp.]|uniref:IS66 family transposase n=1 Tax=Megasphaera sp. TaxID=2023260 RepID=UPI0040256593
MFAWAENNVDKLLSKSPLVTAMNYLLSNRDGLTCYPQDGHCDISNNTAENSIRPFTVGRKNWLFSNSPKGAKANDLDPERYLKYLFEKLPNTANFKDAETLDQYLPWAIKTQEKCKA